MKRIFLFVLITASLLFSVVACNLETDMVFEWEGMVISIIDVERQWESDGFLSSFRPDYGYEHIRINIGLLNNSESILRFGGFDWSIQNSNGLITGAHLWTDGNTLESGELVPGGSHSGFIVFQVPMDDMNLILHYRPNFRREGLAIELN